ncbi:LytR/AlgR family response regulator transcription factor [Gracilimonas sp. Q87]|uniref:LytR/AlgR family response regulator transcription factor n=1 Tax=Gracilimonas sp. Q87 TaxID=3384766 RepID=UPI0039844498
MIKCLIIDDEPAARDILETYITDCPDTEVAGICQDALQARSWLDGHTADLMFVDINMPKLSGLSFIKTLSAPPQIILSTAYSEHAIDAFELGVTDYLLKPFSFERFLKAIDKVKLQSERASGPSSAITVKADGKLYRVLHDDILFAESQGDYITLHSADKNITFYHSLKELSGILPDDQFCRVHRSYVVSLSKIEFLEGNRIKIGDKFIPIGHSYKEAFLQRYTT